MADELGLAQCVRGRRKRESGYRHTAWQMPIWFSSRVNPLTATSLAEHRVVRPAADLIRARRRPDDAGNTPTAASLRLFEAARRWRRSGCAAGAPPHHPRHPVGGDQQPQRALRHHMPTTTFPGVNVDSVDEFLGWPLDFPVVSSARVDPLQVETPAHARRVDRFLMARRPR